MFFWLQGEKNKIGICWSQHTLLRARPSRTTPVGWRDGVMAVNTFLYRFQTLLLQFVNWTTDETESSRPARHRRARIFGGKP